MELPLKITFRALTDTAGTHTIPPLCLRVRATAAQLPVVPERAVVDLQCCMFGCVYRDRLMLRNSGSTAMRVLVNRPAGLQDHLDFQPDFGFVQVGDMGSCDT